MGTVTTMSLMEADQNDEIQAHMAEPLPEVPENTSKTAVSELLKTAGAVLVQRKGNGIIGIITASDVIYGNAEGGLLIANSMSLHRSTTEYRNC